MKYQVVIDTKFEDYIESTVLVEVDTEEQAMAVVGFIREDRPSVLANAGKLQRVVINQVDRFWEEASFRISK